jgi:hypothetical protein
MKIRDLFFGSKVEILKLIKSHEASGESMVSTIV